MQSSRKVLLALFVTGLCVVVTGDADACHNGVDFRINERVIAISQAERQTAQGRHQAAITGALRAFPRLSTRRIGASQLSDRALVVAARAIIRSDGQLELGLLVPKDAEEPRAHSMRWAQHVLRGISLRKPDDPTSATDLGEALERIPAKHEEARRVLEHLEKQNVMASAYGYAALARLRGYVEPEAPGFLTGPMRALEHAPIALDRARCQTMTKDEATCTGEKAQG